MRWLFGPGLGAMLVATSVTASGCCFCNNPFAVAALEDRETQLKAEVRDLERTLQARRKRSLSALQDAMTSGSGFAVRGVSGRVGKLSLRWRSRHGGVPLHGQLVASEAASPDAPASVRIQRGRR